MCAPNRDIGRDLSYPYLACSSSRSSFSCAHSFIVGRAVNEFTYMSCPQETTPLRLHAQRRQRGLQESLTKGLFETRAQVE
jgi:hypothetical protein